MNLRKSTNVFQCKQFAVKQEQAAMKIGTDSMLLGSWASIEHVNNILDIGSGTGILALMLAQRSNADTIDAVEIEAKAYEEAVYNFENSPWADRLFCYHSSIQEFTDEIDDKYDLIICNPPYFDASIIREAKHREIARHTHLLNYITLLKNSSKLLSKNGSFALILPDDTAEFFIELALSFDLSLHHRLRTKDKAHDKFKRSLLQFGYDKKQLQSETLTLKENDNSYTEQFKDLTKEFYLNF